MSEELTPKQREFLETQLIDEREAEVFTNLSQRYRETYMKLVDEQRAFVRALNGPVFVSAGAGAGKTFTLTQRVIYALTPGSAGPGEAFLESLDAALIITFTRDAANEIKERLRLALYEAGLHELAHQVDNAWISTIHGMCSRIIRENALELEVDPNFLVLEPDQSSLMIQQATERAVSEAMAANSAGDSDNSGGLNTNPYKELIEEYGVDSSGVKDMVETLLEKAREELDGFDAIVFPSTAPNAQVAGVDQEVVDAFNRVAPLASQLVDLAKRAEEIYEQAKRAAGMLDNTDLLRKAYEALTQNDSIRASYQDKFKMVMVDEFQDTSTIQFQTICELAGKEGRYLATVGDAQQSIYRFRGADVEVFKHVKEEPNNTLLEIGSNFRSNEEILQFVEYACKNEEMIPESDYLSLRAGREEPEPNKAYPVGMQSRIFIETAVGATNLEESRKSVAEQIADRFANLAAQRNETGDPIVLPSDMTLLLSSMSNASIYIDAFRERGIECVMTGGSVFSELEEVTAITGLIRCLANPQDIQGGLFPLLTSEIFELDVNDILLLRSASRSLWPAIFADEIDGESGRLRIARQTLQRAFRAMSSSELSEVCLQVVKDSGWISRLDKAYNSSKAANILQALRIVKRISKDHGLGWASLAREFERYINDAKLAPAQLTGDKPNAVSIMTIHASKGLEFPVVAMSEFTSPGRSQGKLVLARYEGKLLCALCPKDLTPSAFSSVDVPDSLEECAMPLEWYRFIASVDATQDLEETARKIYVGLTRAKEALVVGLPFGKERNDEASRRLDWVAHALWRDEADNIRATQGEFELDSCGYRFTGKTRVTQLDAEEEGAEALDSTAREPHDTHVPQSVDLFELEPLLSAKQKAIREGVYSFSSASRKVGLHFDEGELDAKTVEQEETKSKTKAAVFEQHDSSQEDAVQPDVAAEDAAPVETTKASFDPDRATNFGSALHAVCEAMTREGLGVDELLPDEQFEAIAKTWHVEPGSLEGAKGKDDLRAALDVWATSELRRHAISEYPLNEAEVPFFVETPSSPFGEYLEGYIDLLASSEDGKEALVVDFKTGYLSYNQDSFQAAHEMQANFYAWVLLDQGYESVTCKFIAVQRMGEDGKPLVASYGPFTSESPATLNF